MLITKNVFFPNSAGHYWGQEFQRMKKKQKMTGTLEWVKNCVLLCIFSSSQIEAQDLLHKPFVKRSKSREWYTRMG